MKTIAAKFYDLADPAGDRLLISVACLFLIPKKNSHLISRLVVPRAFAI